MKWKIGTISLSILLFSFLAARAQEQTLEEKIFDPMLWGHSGFEYSPWIWNSNYGWLLLHESSTEESYWIWIEDLGWLWSSVDAFPEIYLSSIPGIGSGYVLLDISEQVDYKIWIISEKRWMVITRSNFGSGGKAFSEYSMVPEELRGIWAPKYNPEDPTQVRPSNLLSSVKIGNNSLMLQSSSENFRQVDFYYYSENDGWFYPLKSNFQPSDLSSNTYYSMPIFLGQRLKVHVEGNKLVLNKESVFGDSSSQEIITIYSTDTP